MKTTKILATVVATAIISTLTLNTFAMGNGNGQGNGQGQGMGKGQGQNQWQGQGKAQSGNKGNSSKSHSPETMLSGVATGTLSEQEKLSLAYQYSEEMVARDAYTYFYSLYGTQTFQNIANAESEHMAAVKVLLDRYSLPTPTGYGELQSTFDTLKSEGEKGLKEALEVGVKIEILDIDDITKTIKSTDNDDIKIVFTNIGGASYNHMRGFAKALNNNGFTTSIDFSAYLSQDEVNSRGSLKNKLSETLVSEGVSLPNQVNSRNNMQSQIGNKYGKSLEKLSDDKLQKLDSKIDTAISKVENNTSMASKIKEKTLNIYNALKNYISSLFE